MRDFLLILFVCIAVMLVPGCAGYGAQVKDYAENGAKRAAEAADFGLDAGIWSACTKPTVGSIRRQFPTEEERKAYFDACDVLIDKQPKGDDS